MKRKYLVAAFAVAVMAAVFLTGCGERVENVETQPAPVTEAVTEAVTEVQIETQPATEPPTEPPTEKITETEPPTEAPDVDLTPEEELAQETPLSAAVTYYASDDINVRETPSTENSDNIISSYDQGEAVSVIAKTPHWYKVQKEDFTGYVSRKFVSETNVEPKSDEEREQADAAAAAAAAAAAQQPAPEQTAPAADAGVAGYADSFPIQIASDANVRASAGENADVIGVLDAGTTATAIGESGNWYQISYNGTTGFVNKNLVG